LKAARLFLVPLAVWFGTQSCVTDNEAAYQGIFGADRGRTPSSGGSDASGGSTGGTGGPTGGSPTTGGSATAAAAGMGDGGDGTTGGTGGSTVNPPPHPDFLPPCYLSTTQAGDEILKGTPCTSADVKVCYRPCGPSQVGWKKEQCKAGVYAEEDCLFPEDMDFSCYRIPDVIDEAACGVTAPPAATGECTAPLCMPCNFEGSYQDTGADVKEGYCTCREPDAEGVRRWTCASTMAWPCPSSRGCF